MANTGEIKRIYAIHQKVVDCARVGDEREGYRRHYLMLVSLSVPFSLPRISHHYAFFFAIVMRTKFGIKSNSLAKFTS